MTMYVYFDIAFERLSLYGMNFHVKFCLEIITFLVHLPSFKVYQSDHENTDRSIIRYGEAVFQKLARFFLCINTFRKNLRESSNL